LKAIAPGGFAWSGKRAISIETMMRSAGLVDIRFSPGLPYWRALGRKEE